MRSVRSSPVRSSGLMMAATARRGPSTMASSTSGRRSSPDASTPPMSRAVRFARAQGLDISVRGGGHNVAGKAVTEGGVMVDLARMRGSCVDPARRHARVHGGATWNDYNRATHQHGLATTGGVISTTGVAGLTLGGGLGWLMGHFGMAVDNLTSSNSSPRTVTCWRSTRTPNPNCSGACGAVVATSGSPSRSSSRPILDTILGGIVAYPLARALPVFAAYQEVTADPPDELVSFFGLVHAPDGSGHKSSRCPSATVATSPPERRSSPRCARSARRRSI